MLIPAIIKKDEILEAFKRYYYTDDMMYETGSLSNWLPHIQEETENGHFQYAIVDADEKLIGYLDYQIDWYCSCASRFGLISFDRGNPTIGKDLFNELNKLINDYKLHRIEWRMVGGNPVERSYDRFCKNFGGTKHILKDVAKDKYGKYHDDIIYEIINDQVKRNRRDMVLTEQPSSDCCIALKERCSMECNLCTCKECDKRFDCDGGNPYTGCDG